MVVKSPVKLKLMRLEERRQQRMTLKTLYEKKATSLCGNRDQNFLEKVAETRQTAARVPFSNSFTDVDVMEVELEFKRQSSHGPLNYYLTKADQINRNQKI